MGHSRARLILVTAVTLAAIATFGAAPATVAPAAADEGVRTTLVAGHPNPLKIHLSLQPRAKLTVTETGAPLEGQLVRFWIPDAWAPFCSAYTDTKGVAQCGVSITVLRDIILTGGIYEASFYGADIGDQWHWGSDDTVRLLAPQ
jgi:hypothetical protein